MAGHSKWANIKHKKAAVDAKRGKIFTRLIRELMVAARDNGDPEMNPRLRLAIDKANAANMPKDKVERAILKGSGQLAGDAMEEIRYEGYGPQGVAILIDCMSDNRNRTVSTVRHCLSKHGGNLGTSGSVAYLFNKKGLILVESNTGDALLETALNAGALDVTEEGDQRYTVTTSGEDFHAVLSALEADTCTIIDHDLTWIADDQLELSATDGSKIASLLEKIEDLDDVQDVYCNATWPQEDA